MASTIPAAFLGTIPSGTVTGEWDGERGTLEVRRVQD